MKNKIVKTISACLITLLFSIAFVTVITNQINERIHIGKAEPNSDYVLTLNSSNGRISDANYSDDIKTINTSVTTSGANFSLSYYHAKGKSGNHCLLDAYHPKTNSSGKDGYLYTTNGVNGLDSISINYSYENGSIPGDLLVYFSSNTTFNGDPIIAESGKTITANGSYFKIEALSQSVVINNIVINYSCDENTHIYPEDAEITHTSKTTTALSITEPTNDLVNDFAFGVDMSMVAETEQLGGVYKNENNVAEDPFQILADDGANYARIRLWVDPYTTSGRAAYEGGTNDLDTDIHLAKRAKAAGMKVLLDIHYSDFWADPSHQWKPKSWASTTPSQITTYTTDVLNAFKDEGITIDSVQVGNEINISMAGVSVGSSYYALLNAGISAVKNVFPSAKTILHLTNVNKSSIYTYIDNLCSNVSNFDILGLSYYPFWHGTTNNLLTVMNYIANKGKDVMVVETSWVWTLTADSNWYSTSQVDEDDVTSVGHPASPQGQMDALCAVVDALSQVNNSHGKGLFYWGPDYLAIYGAHWASKEGQYYNDHGSDGTGSYTDDSCRISWANQSLFDYNGKVIGSAQTYKLLQSNVSPVTPVTYAQDTTDMSIAVVTYTGDEITSWGSANIMSYDSSTDNWTYTITLASTNEGIQIYSSHQSVWTEGGVGNWYFMSANSSLFNSSNPYLVKSAGTYLITVKDSDVDGDDTTSFGYYMKNWNNSGIISSISIEKL